MKKIIAVILSLVLVCSCSLPCAAEENEKYSATFGSHSMDGQIPVLGKDPLIENAKAVLLYEVNTDTLMYAYNADEKIQPSSMLKILTALVAIREGDLAAEVVVKEDVLSSVPKDAARTKFEAGEKLTLGDLLYCMLVDSGNDAAALIAVHIAGSQDAFVDKLNAYAAELGCTDSYFTNVHGLPDENQYTTTRDIGRFLAAAVRDETFCEIFGTVNYNVPANNIAPERKLKTGNYLLDKDEIYYDQRVVGSRTGVLSDGSRCVASVAEENGLRAISIIIGAQSEFAPNGATKVFGGYHETSDLLDLGFADYRSKQLIYSGQVLLQRDVVNGNCSVNLGTREAAASVLPKGVTLDHITVEFSHLVDPLNAPIAEGEVLSTVRYMYGGVCVAEVELYSLNAVQEHTQTMVLEPKSKSDDGMSFSMKLLLILVAALVLYMLYRIYLLKRKGRNQQRSR